MTSFLLLQVTKPSSEEKNTVKLLDNLLNLVGAFGCHFRVCWYIKHWGLAITWAPLVVAALHLRWFSSAIPSAIAGRGICTWSSASLNTTTARLGTVTPLRPGRPVTMNWHLKVQMSLCAPIQLNAGANISLLKTCDSELNKSSSTKLPSES